MASLFSGFFGWLRSLFFAKHLEVTIVGLQVCYASLSFPRRARHRARAASYSKGYVADSIGKRQDIVSPSTFHSFGPAGRDLDLSTLADVFQPPQDDGIVGSRY